MSTGSVKIPRSLTSWSLVGLVAGLGLGLVGYQLESDLIVSFAGLIRPLGTLWMNALQMSVIPLVVAQLMAAIVVDRGGDSVGGLGGRALGLFFAMLFGAGMVTYLVLSPSLGFYAPDPGVVAAMSAEVPPAALAAAERGAVPFGEWLTGIVPTNVFEVVARGDILPLLVFVVLFAMAATKLPSEQRESFGSIVQALADAMMNLIVWILWGTPVAVFAILLGVALNSGAGAVGVLGVFVVGQSSALVVITLLLYPLTALFGGTSFATFVRATAPAQLVALSTRSSLASLPALVEGGQEHLRLPRSATGFVLPLCVSSFKINQAVSTTFKVMFLAHLLGIPFGPAQMATFLITVVLISFSVVGVPRGGGGFNSLPAYLAAGIPIEVYVVFEAVKTIPDMFMTALNVTGDMSVAAILSKKERAGGSLLTAGVGRQTALAEDRR